MRVVLDTNVLVSALISRGKSRTLLRLIKAKDHSLIISNPILEELSRVAADEKVSRYVSGEDFEEFLKTLLEKSTLVRANSKVHIFNDADDRILSTARDGKADIIVTGDKHMLRLKTFRHIRIITVDQALRILK